MPPNPTLGSPWLSTAGGLEGSGPAHIFSAFWVPPWLRAG